MSTPMNIGVVVQVKAGNGIDDAAGFLCCGGVIQPDEWLAVNLLVQNGKICFDLQWIEDSSSGGGLETVGGHAVDFGSDAVEARGQQSGWVCVLQAVQLTDEARHCGSGGLGSVGWRREFGLQA